MRITPSNKATRTKLEKWLQEEEGCVVDSEAQTTSSKYLIYNGNVTIRIADHIGSTRADVSVIFPEFGEGYIFLFGVHVFICKTIKEIKERLHNALLYKSYVVEDSGFTTSDEVARVSNTLKDLKVKYSNLLEEKERLIEQRTTGPFSINGLEFFINGNTISTEILSDKQKAQIVTWYRQMLGTKAVKKLIAQKEIEKMTNPSK